MTVLAAEDMRRMYEEASVIAVVGLSADPDKPAHKVPRYLQEMGYRVVPVNPRVETLLGELSHDSLSDVEEPIDVVVAFRPADEAPAIASDAAAAGARVLWLQDGIVSDEARRIAEESGLGFVMDNCIGRMHGELGLGPGP